MKIYLKSQPRAKTGRYTSKFRGSTVTTHTYIGLAWLILAVLIILYSLYRQAQNQPLISPAPVEEEAPKEQSAAPSVVYQCEIKLYDFLMCEAAKGNITWDEADILYAIARAESGLNPEAVNINKNGSYDRGIFQINSVHKSLSNEDAFDWRENAKYAIKIMKTSGFYPWTVYRTGVYKRFISTNEI